MSFRYWSPPARVMAILLWMFCISSLRRLDSLAIATLLVALLYLLSHVPWQRLGKRLQQMGLFFLGLWLLLAVTAWPIALLLTWRLVLCLALGVVLLESLTFSEWVRVCRWWGLPPLLVDTLALTYRYLFELESQLTQMQQALFLRGFRLSWRRLRPWAQVIGIFLIRAEERAQQIYLAMRLRGYGQVLQRRPQFSEGAPWSWGLTLSASLGAGLLAIYDALGEIQLPF
ncbi:energy-coupling factor transporter transmembrane component T [Thermosynechococcus sp. JY1334]|uniref:energy-coupling factor transporter transmembrane component T family protein n=1 Tax=unclassified Thermosynechococcus TaxID=2622553 RepID=UPI0026711DEC|nr:MULTISPECIES: energy-coupling factor transporter transmembrane component T [unclassified Thermosynechococcus]MDR7898297.1 energy-coupling factor transporter transmembrane component T [Thermosynechococcus sp. JY1332]MDR7905699.1 energy-coupling factor transporter transmembrane component T [Thermosynechococcus sp. JY1334]WKT85425.1 energy-coupling factor transporter transmembrane component T [Thermosynechococcus sp. JY1339]WNC51726.1 energy-coupling factor transporter transmembrane component T